MKRQVGLVAFVLVMFLVACTSPPAFKGGIRVQTVESITGITNSTFPVSGVLDYGSASNGGSNNGAQSFEGVTGSYGIDDHTGVAVGTDWTVTVNYANAIPECGPADYAAFVPNTGAVFTGVCYVIS